MYLSPRSPLRREGVRPDDLKSSSQSVNADALGGKETVVGGALYKVSLGQGTELHVDGLGGSHMETWWLAHDLAWLC